MRICLVILLLALVAVCCASASAGTISSQFVFDMGFVTGSRTFWVNNINILTFDLSAAMGQTFWFDANHDINCFLAKYQLTDGVLDSFIIKNAAANTAVTSDWFPGVEGTGNLDFIGYRINRIGLAVDYMEFPRETFLVDYSPVPEPSSLVALLCGAAGLGAIRLRRRAA